MVARAQPVMEGVCGAVPTSDREAEGSGWTWSWLYVSWPTPATHFPLLGSLLMSPQPPEILVSGVACEFPSKQARFLCKVPS